MTRGFIGCIDHRRDNSLVRLRSIDLGSNALLSTITRSLAETLEQFVDSLGNGFVARRERARGRGARLILEPMLFRTPNDLH